MRKEIEEIKVKTEVEHKDIMSGEGIELVPLMKDKHTGEYVEENIYCHCRHIY